ncbi:MAG: radical SAM protein [Chitinispirillia bacterium]|nr:radical SAM protein [Chitinispirillia bacterium]MCL2240917.1 radical SAM protein [Chitinispirillia bacterium]
MINGNFCWIATWKVTDRCNLRCTYCDPSIMTRADACENMNRFEALDRIAAYRPRVLNISGGEPSLVKELPGLLARAKAVWNPSVRVVHNGTGPEKLSESFPYIDRLVISIDGPGEVNAATRGISGDAVLERIARLLAGRGGSLPGSDKSADGALPEITVNTVVTEANIGTLPGFASQVNSVSPNIGLALLPVMPVECELSVLREGEKGYRRFLDVYAKMKLAHGAVVHNFDCVMRHGDFRKIQCYNQYFTVRFSPRGEFFACGANIGSQLRRTDGVFKKVFRKGGVRKLFTMLSRALKGGMGKVDFTCRNMCNCDSWLDMLFLGQDTGYAPITLRGLRGRLSDGDYRELDEFVRKNINSGFDVNRFRVMVEGCGNDGV